jgi:hypothetical protein
MQALSRLRPDQTKKTPMRSRGKERRRLSTATAQTVAANNPDSTADGIRQPSGIQHETQSRIVKAFRISMYEIATTQSTGFSASSRVNYATIAQHPGRVAHCRNGVLIELLTPTETNTAVRRPIIL